jgi:translation initiation factor 3 subunit C
LCDMFDLSRNDVHSIVSKMMINRELHASWDQPTDTIVLRKVEASSLQLLALQFAEKAANLVETNERLLDTKTGNFHFRDGEGQRYDNNRGGQRRFGAGGGRGRGGDQKRGGRGGRSGGRGYKGRGGGGRN